MRSKSSGHLAISASAGSGKTTRLAYRYINLLADPDRQITPGRICAMTFTRKAAGEIFDKIADKIRVAASEKDPDAEKTRMDLKMAHMKQKDFITLLRLFLDNLHRINIGTMDSFIVSVAKAFPLELGIPMDFQVTDAEGTTASENRKAVLAALLTPSASSLKASVQKSFLEAFKLATFGLEEKSFGELLDKFITSYHTKYRLCPDAAKWGDEKKIWPGKGRPWKFKPEHLVENADETIKWIESRRTAADKDYMRFLDELKATVQALANYGPTMPWDKTFDSIIGKRVIEQVLDSGPTGLEIKSGKKDYGIDENAAKAIEKLVHNLVAVEIDRSLKRSLGIYNLLSHYDTAYDEISRQTGRFSFSDLQYLLAFGDRSGKGPHISRKSGEEDKLYIDYRMDARLDHWLLDEFQDTSDMQWMIFDNLISELIQSSPEGDERSFFYVGDVKQAIYRWRGGDQELFREIYDKFKVQAKTFDFETMSRTYRCSESVIDAVNKVFSKLPEETLPKNSVTKWNDPKIWSEHKTFSKDRGYAAILEPPQTKENNNIEARFMLVADLLNEIQPLKRGLGVGILVRTNDTGSKMVATLRNKCPGMNFVHEGKSGIISNELAQALLSLVKLAAHPGDEFAWKHVLMTPLNKVLKEKKMDRDNISILLLKEIENTGFQPFINNWGNLLDGASHEYGRECLSRLENAAAEFDASGQRNCNSFLTFVNEYEIHEPASHTSVRIMTIHQAKGLEFDIVILPELQDGKMNMVKAEPPDLICAGKPSAPDWILKAPKRIVIEHDPELGKQVERSNEDNCFDILCLLYVAMTRAKHGLYIVTTHQEEGKSETFRPSRFIKQQLTGEKELEAEPNIIINGKPYIRLYPAKPGGENWYEPDWPDRKEKKSGEPIIVKAAKKHPSSRTLLKRSEPSKQESFVRKAADLFEPESRDVLDFGSAIHELLEKVGWCDERTDVEKIINEWSPSAGCSGEIYTDVCTQFRNTLKSEDIRKALSKPDENSLLRREWKFDIILDNEWVSGAFDRVIILNNADGKPVGATIMDYKSNRIEPTPSQISHVLERYRKQMEIYRRALSHILGISEKNIELKLLLTRIHKIVQYKHE